MGINREIIDCYITRINARIKLSNSRCFTFVPPSDAYRYALILFCIENNYEYDSSSYIFTIDKRTGL